MIHNFTGLFSSHCKTVFLMLEENDRGEIAAAGVSQLVICCGLFGH